MDLAYKIYDTDKKEYVSPNKVYATLGGAKSALKTGRWFRHNKNLVVHEFELVPTNRKD